MSKWENVPKVDRERIFAYNKQKKEAESKAINLDEIISAINALPKGQKKKVIEACPEIEPYLEKHKGVKE